MKKDVEKRTGKRCAVVYGSLPPETRAQQAALFNDPNNDYDFLVASDAVGMGLNLSIKRVIFEATSKHDGVGFRMIQPSEIKQIAGRAGRYKSAHDAVKSDIQETKVLEGTTAHAELQATAQGTDNCGGTTVFEEPTPLQLLLAEAAGPRPDLVKKPSTNRGYVTTLENFDLAIVQKAMNMEVEPIKSAGIFPPADIIIKFARYFPAGTPFSYIVLRLHELAIMDDKFHICRLKEQLEISDAIQDFALTVQDRLIFMSAPVSMKDPGFKDVLREFAECIATQSGGELLDIGSLNLELIEANPSDHAKGSMGYLREAESLHKQMTLYLWLSYRFAGVFRSQALAFHVKSLIEQKIDECLADVSWNVQKRREAIAARRKVLEMQEKYAEEARRAQEQQDEEQNKDRSKRELTYAREATESAVEEHFQDLAATTGDGMEDVESFIDAESTKDFDVEEEFERAAYDQDLKLEEIDSRILEAGEVDSAQEAITPMDDEKHVEAATCHGAPTRQHAEASTKISEQPRDTIETTLENRQALADQATINSSPETADALLNILESVPNVSVLPQTPAIEQGSDVNV